MGRSQEEPGAPARPGAVECAEGAQDIVETVERWAEVALPPLAPPRPKPFRFSLVAPPEVSSARLWRPGSAGMSGSFANAHVTSGYQALDGAFAAYIGDPPVVAWVTFAKYASRQAGEWIRILEAWMTLASTFGARGSLLRGLTAGRDLWVALGDTEVRTEAREIVRASLRGALALSGVDPRRAPEIVRDALVEANTDIFSRIGLGFHVFLEAESRGGDGREAISAAIRDGRLIDPMGHLTRAFARYRCARRLGLSLPSCARGDRQLLLTMRRHLVADANWLIAIQEQALIQRPTIFEHPLVRAVFGSIPPGLMRLPFMRGGPRAGIDPFTLIPHGGNWADYADRMGLEEIDIAAQHADAVIVRFERGARAYLPAFGRRGTILDLFSRYLDGPAGEQLRRGAPRSWRGAAR